MNLENHMVLPGPWTGNPNDPNAPDADEPSAEEQAEIAAREKREAAAAEYADGLRQIADFVEEHPDFPLPGDLYMFLYDRKDFLSAVSILTKGGKVEKSADPMDSISPNYHADRAFGSVSIRMHINRSTICRLVRPAEYECPDSLLEAAAEYAEA